MSRIRLAALLAGAAALGLAAASGCGNNAAPPATPPAADAAPSDAPESDAVKAMREKAEKATEAQREQLDKDARGLLASCDARVYRPQRDAGLERAAGRIDVKCGGKEASYRFSYDVKNPADRPVTFETLSEPGGWDPGVAADVRRWGVIACVSAYEVVAY